ncbi:MAG: glycosyltransferase family 2 protein [Actinomycetota bacterium]
MTGPNVSVGLPVYNGERYLAEAIDSILSQDYGDLELIVCDNGSTDATPRIAADAARRDARVSVHRSGTNRGAAWNYNRAVALARGRFFKWAAHDDVLRRGFLSACVAVLEERPEVVLAYTRAVDVDDQGRVVHEHDLPRYATASTPSGRARQVLLDPSPCLESFGVIRADALRRTRLIGPYTSSDRTLFLELALLGEFHEVPEVLFLHRQHPHRSVHSYADPRWRNVWFDPAWSGRRSSPRWRLLKEYATAVARSPVPPGERLRTAGLLPLWAASNANALAREAAAVAVGRARTPGTAMSTTRVERS